MHGHGEEAGVGRGAVGAYLLHEQVEQDEPGRGELYRATHETTGATALVLKPTGDGPLPLGQWQVHCVSSASPGYLALEVERTSWSRTPDRHWVEGLVYTLEDVFEAVRRMARAVDGSEDPTNSDGGVENSTGVIGGRTPPAQ